MVGFFFARVAPFLVFMFLLASSFATIATDDLVIGAFTPNVGLIGRTHIVFGSSEPFDANEAVAALSDGVHGVRLLGVEPNGRLGTRVGGAGDVNGDGLDDVIAGEPCCGVSFVLLGGP